MFLGLGLSICSSRAAEAAPFTPADLPGLLIWVESDTLVQAGTVSSWTNQADGTNPLINSTAGFRPAYNATDADFNGEPSVQFTHTTPHWLRSTNNITIGAFTVVIVCKVTAASGNIWMVHDGTKFAFSRSDLSSLGANYGVGSDKQLSATWAVDALAMTMVHRFDGTHAGHTLEVNGVAQTLGNGASTSNPGTGGVTHQFGLMARANSAAPVSGKVVAVYVANEAWSNDDIASLRTYLQAKYAHY